MKELLVVTSRFDYGFQNIGIRRLLIKRLLPYLFIALSLLILSACSGSDPDPNIVEFRLDSEEVLFYQLSDYEIEFDKRDEIVDLVNQINYYSENVIELNNDEKRFLFFSYVVNLNIIYDPTNIIVDYLFDGNSTFYEINFLNGWFDDYYQSYESRQTYITCNLENICRESSIEEILYFKNSDTLRRLNTPRISSIAIGHLIYYADSPHHDIAARVALAQTHLISPGFRRSYSRYGLKGDRLAEEKIQLTWFREYCSPSLSNCQEIITILQRYVIDLNNETITFDDDDYSSNRITSYGLIDENFNDYFNIYNENFVVDAYVVNGVINNEKYNALKGDFSGNEGLENLRNYIFHDEQE